MSEIILLIDDLRSYNSSCVTSMCRICHEAEFESCKPLETPCACSGTLKFAHRDCVQRWCNEKGNTVCEICLQKFESGYISPPPKKTQLIDATVTIRGSLEVPRNDEEEEENRGGEIIEREYSECESAAGERSSCCKSVALIFTALLLIRHLLGVISGGAGGAYPFSLLTVLIVKASGIVLPMYILTRVIVALQTTITHHYHNTDTYTSSDDDDEEDEEDEEAA